MSGEYSFRLRRGEVEIALEGDRSFVETQLERFLPALFPDLTLAAASGAVQQPIRVRKNIDLKDFFELKRPQSSADYVLLTAYFLEKYEYRSDASLAEIERLLQTVGQAELPVEEGLEEGISNGFLTEALPAQEEKRYTITFSGELHVRDEMG